MNDDIHILRSSINEFSLLNIKPIVQDLDCCESSDERFIEQLSLMGMVGITIPEEIGGLGLEYDSYSVILQETAAHSCSYALVVALINTLGLETLMSAGKEHIVADILLGKSIATGTIVNDKNPFVITMLDNIPLTEYFLYIYPDDNLAILSRNEYEKLNKCVVKDKFGLRSICMSKMSNDTTVPRIYTCDYKKILANMQIAISAIAIGACNGVLGYVQRYTAERTISGKCIRDYKANALRISNMILRLHAAQSALTLAIDKKSKCLDYYKDALFSKFLSIEAVKSITDDSIQLLGAYGLTTEYDLERFYRDCRMLELLDLTPSVSMDKLLDL